MLPQGDALLLHLDELLVLHLLQVMVAPLVCHLLQHLRVREHEDGVAALQQVAIVTADALHRAALGGTHTHRRDGADEAVHIHVFQKVAVAHHGQFIAADLHFQGLRSQLQDHDISHQGDEYGTAQQIHTVLHIPRLRG